MTIILVQTQLLRAVLENLKQKFFQSNCMYTKKHEKLSRDRQKMMKRAIQTNSTTNDAVNEYVARRNFLSKNVYPSVAGVNLNGRCKKLQLRRP